MRYAGANCGHSYLRTDGSCIHAYLAGYLSLAFLMLHGYVGDGMRCADFAGDAATMNEWSPK